MTTRKGGYVGVRRGIFKMRLVTGSRRHNLTLTFRTLSGAQRGAARRLGTETPKLDPKGFAVGDNGACLYFLEGCRFEEIFPKVCKTT